MLFSQLKNGEKKIQAIIDVKPNHNGMILGNKFKEDNRMDELLRLKERVDIAIEIGESYYRDSLLIWQHQRP